MHTFRRLSLDFVQRNSLLCSPFAESVHTLSRATCFIRVSRAEAAVPRPPAPAPTSPWEKRWRRRARPAPTSKRRPRRAPPLSGAAAFEDEPAVAQGAGGGDMEAAFGGPFVPSRSIALPPQPPFPARTTPPPAPREPGGHLEGRGGRLGVGGGRALAGARRGPGAGLGRGGTRREGWRLAAQARARADRHARAHAAGLADRLGRRGVLAAPDVLVRAKIRKRLSSGVSGGCL